MSLGRLLYRLDACSPEWVADKEHWGAGVRWKCPTCEKTHEVRFANPTDGGIGRGTYCRIGASFSTLGIAGRLVLPCFSGWLYQGEFRAG